MGLRALHLNHIITFLLHSRKFVSIIYFDFLTSSASETENWQDETCSNKERDIENVSCKINIVYIVIENETFQQTFVNKTIKKSL